jgi:hypothetical protein
MATTSPVDQSKKPCSLDGGDKEIEICDSMAEETAEEITGSIVAMNFAAVDDTGLKAAASSNDGSTSSSTAESSTSTSGEKDEKLLTTSTRLMTTTCSKDSPTPRRQIVLVKQTKKKNATRPSFNEFFKQAAAAAAARQQEQLRPKTRNRGKRRHETNPCTSNGALNKAPGDGEPSTKSSNSNNNSSRSRGNSQKGTENTAGKHRTTEKGETFPPSKKQKKTSLPQPQQQAAPQPAAVEQRPVIDNIVEPRLDDVLMGRGKPIANWHGNVKFRSTYKIFCIIECLESRSTT